MGKTGNLTNNELSVGGMILGFSWVKEVSLVCFHCVLSFLMGAQNLGEFMALEKCVT